MSCNCNNDYCLFEGDEVTCSEYLDYANCHKERCTLNDKDSDFECCCKPEMDRQQRVKIQDAVFKLKKHIRNLVK